ncbi:MAG: acyl-CoA dehydrogenase family protein [Bdellovibrionota bacterium]
MKIEFSENHNMIREMVRDFAKNEVAPGAIHRDEKCEFPLELCRKAGELGLMGILVPEEFGGSNMDVTSFAIAIEEVGRYDGSMALSMQANNGLSCGHILTAGSDALKKKYLPDLASGQKLGAWCLTEPGSGSDAGAMKTTAVKKGDRWIVNGSKNFITHGTYGDTYIIMAKPIQAKVPKASQLLLRKKLEGFEHR